MAKELIFHSACNGEVNFTCSGSCGLIGISFLPPGHEMPPKVVRSRLESIVQHPSIVEEQAWGERFFAALSRELTEGELARLKDFGFSLTVVEPVSGGVRIGTIGSHYVCAYWPGTGVARLMHADILSEHPDIQYRVGTTRPEMRYRVYHTGSTIRSLNWRTEFLSSRMAIVVVDTHERIATARDVHSRTNLLETGPEEFCKRVVEQEGLCLAALRPA